MNQKVNENKGLSIDSSKLLSFSNLIDFKRNSIITQFINNRPKLNLVWSVGLPKVAVLEKYFCFEVGLTFPSFCGSMRHG